MRWLPVAVVAVVATGCGSDEKTVVDKVRAEMAKVQTTCASGVNCAADSPRRFRKCINVSRGFRACSTFFASDHRSVIYRRDGERWRKVIGPLPRGSGWWRRVLPSADRRTLLAQWSGECEIQTTYLVSLADRRPRPIFARHTSGALGWSADGRARVVLVEPVYGTHTEVRYRPGRYLVDPVTMAVQLERPLASGHGC
jgi:hypothetical protein